MKKLIKQSAWLFLVIASVVMSSCSSKSSSEDSDYVSVQIEDSKMWSLLDVGSGNLVMTDEFFAPATRVVKGSFFIENDNGEFDLYNLSDTKNKLNRSSYSEIANFNIDGFSIVRVKDEPWQIIDTKGNVVATLDKNIKVMSGFSNEGLAQIKNKDNMIGYVNTKGEEQIKPRYKYGTFFSDGIAFVLTKQEDNHNYFAAIDPAGQTVFSFSDAKYSSIGLFNQGYVFAIEGDHSVLLDKAGKKIMNVCNSTEISNLSYDDGKLIYYDGQFYGLKDKEDKILIRAKYKHLKFQSDGNLLAVNNNGKYGVISSDDDIVIPFDYDILEYLAPNRYITQTGSVYVMIDSKGKEICDKAFSNFLNRSSTASENNLVSLISAETNNVSSDNVFDDNSFNLNLSDMDAWLNEDMYLQPGLTIGEHHGLIDGKTAIVMEITSCDGNKIFGNTYYPNSVAKYGKTSNTLMPFSGIIEDGHIQLIVKSPTDATYGEDWDLWLGEGIMGGNISTSTGKYWNVVLDM